MWPPPQVLVEFVSDGAGTSSGFNITATEHTAGCGGVLHGMVCSCSSMQMPYSVTAHQTDLCQYVRTTFAQGGVIQSPRAEGSTQYPASTECTWELRTDPGYHTEVLPTPPAPTPPRSPLRAGSTLSCRRTARRTMWRCRAGRRAVSAG